MPDMCVGTNPPCHDNIDIASRPILPSYPGQKTAKNTMKRARRNGPASEFEATLERAERQAGSDEIAFSQIAAKVADRAFGVIGLQLPILEHQLAGIARMR